MAYGTFVMVEYRYAFQQSFDCVLLLNEDFNVRIYFSVVQRVFSFFFLKNLKCLQEWYHFGEYL